MYELPACIYLLGLFSVFSFFLFLFFYISHIGAGDVVANKTKQERPDKVLDVSPMVCLSKLGFILIPPSCTGLFVIEERRKGRLCPCHVLK